MEDGTGAGAAPPCRVCGGPARCGYAHCFCCAALVRHLQLPLAPLVTVTSYRLGDPVHRLLRGYKDSPVVEVRDRCRTRLSAMVRAWLAAGGDGVLAGRVGRWDAVVTVPSTCRPAGAPVDGIVASVPSLVRCRQPWLVRGPVPTGHLRASRHGFSLAPGTDPAALHGRRVLVVDDTVVTGARAQSAVATLRAGGCRVAGILAVGRVVPHGTPGAGTGKGTDAGSGDTTSERETSWSQP